METHGLKCVGPCSEAQPTFIKPNRRSPFSGPPSGHISMLCCISFAKPTLTTPLWRSWQRQADELPVSKDKIPPALPAYSNPYLHLPASRIQGHAGLWIFVAPCSICCAKITRYQGPPVRRRSEHRCHSRVHTIPRLPNVPLCLAVPMLPPRELLSHLAAPHMQRQFTSFSLTCWALNRE